MMEKVSKTACCQIIEVLQHIEVNVFSMIPVSLRNFLYMNREITYIPDIDFTKENWEDDLEDDAKAMLALIYRDYMVSKEEHEELIRQEEAAKMEILKRRQEEEQKKRYEEISNMQVEKQVDLLLEKREPLYKKIIQLIKDIFKRKDD